MVKKLEIKLGFSFIKIHTTTMFMQDTNRENKLRLLMILASIYPEKFEGEKGLNLMKVQFL